MTTITTDRRRPPRLALTALAVVGLTVLVIAAAVAWRAMPDVPARGAIHPAPSAASAGSVASAAPVAAPPVAAIAPTVPAASGGPLAVAGAGTVATTPDLERIRSDVAFWGGRFAKSPRDFLSATRLAASEIDLARATGDVTAYLAASTAIDGALAAYPGYALALDYRGAIQVALHQFAAARDTAKGILVATPDDPSAIATLGDAQLELGDVSSAKKAFDRLTALDDSAAARVRQAHLAFIVGHTDVAVRLARSAVPAAKAEGATGNGLAWYDYQLGDTLITTGDRTGAAKSYRAALAADPRFHLAHWGLARVAVADGDLDTAIAQVSDAIAIVPLPESVARRADLYRLRGAPGDAKREADDRATVVAIAQLAGEAASVYDRTLALYLAGSGGDPVKALSLAQNEIAVRHDVYGYDALAWALLANDRPQEADAAMTTALSFGTRDAKLLYHAAMIAHALGDDAKARDLLGQAVDLDPSADPLGMTMAEVTLGVRP